MKVIARQTDQGREWCVCLTELEMLDLTTDCAGIRLVQILPYSMSMTLAADLVKACLQGQAVPEEHKKSKIGQLLGAIAVNGKDPTFCYPPEV